MSQKPIGSNPSQASTKQISTWISYCIEYHFAKLNYERESFKSSIASWKKVSCQNQIGWCSSWFQIVSSGKQDVQSLIDPIVQIWQFVLFETENFFVEFPNVMKLWVSCRTISRQTWVWLKGQRIVEAAGPPLPASKIGRTSALLRPTKAGLYCRDRPPRPAVSAVPGRARRPASTAVTVQGSRERELSQAPLANHAMVCEPQRLLPGPCPMLWRVRLNACARLPGLPAGSR